MTHTPPEPRRAVDIWGVLRDAFQDWLDDKAPMHGAALAFYSILSLAPLVLICIAVAGALFGEKAASGEVLTQVRGLVGEEAGKVVEAMLINARRPGAGLAASIIGVVTLLFGAAGVFGQLKDSLNTIWEVPPRPSNGVWGFVRSQALSFVMVLGISFLLILSLVISSVLSGVQTFAQGFLGDFGLLAEILNQLVSFGLIVLLFALTYRVLPDVDLGWRDVWTGAVITSALFVLGKFLIGLYLGKASVGSAYGAAGSLVVVLVWVFYSAQVLYYGAEVTQVYANRYGSRIGKGEPAVNATPNRVQEPGAEILQRPDFHRPRGR